MRSLVVTALLVCLPAKGQQRVDLVPVSIDVHHGVVVQQDGGMVDVFGGEWRSTEELIRQSKEHADLRTQNESLVSHASDMPLKWVTASILIGVAIGAAGGYLAAKTIK